MHKRGVSPVVATVLLVAITIVLAAIIFLWARSFLSEGAEKQGRAVELVCEEINFAANLAEETDGTVSIDITNRGNVPIYGMIVKDTSEAGSVTPCDVVLELNIGESTTQSLDECGNPRRVLAVPVLIAEQDSGNRLTYPCDDRYGQELEL